MAYSYIVDVKLPISIAYANCLFELPAWRGLPVKMETMFFSFHNHIYQPTFDIFQTWPRYWMAIQIESTVSYNLIYIYLLSNTVLESVKRMGEVSYRARYELGSRRSWGSRIWEGRSRRPEVNERSRVTVGFYRVQSDSDYGIVVFSLFNRKHQPT